MERKLGLKPEGKEEGSILDKILPLMKVQIVMVWSLVFIALVIYAMVWFSFGAVAISYIDAIDSSFSFDAPWDSVVTLAKNVVLWHPVISIFGWILWGFMNSMKRDVDTWRVG